VEKSNILKYINLADVVIGLVALCGPIHLRTCVNLAGVAIGLVELRGPMHLRACVSEERGDGEGALILTHSVQLFSS